MAEQESLNLSDPKSLGALISTSRVAEHHLVVLGDYVSGAVFSEDRKHRYRLWRNWSDAEGRARRVACWIMLNPSTADEMVLDPTIRRCVSFSKAWGYGGIEIVNVFGLRSTNPAGLKAVQDPVGPYNDLAIVEVASRADVGVVVAAWGVHARQRGREKQVTGMLLEKRVDVRHLGPANKDGSPRHPLYVKGTTLPVPYRPG